MSVIVTLEIKAPKSADSATVAFVKELLTGAEFEVEAGGYTVVRRLVAATLAGETDGSRPLEAAVDAYGIISAYDPARNRWTRIGTWRERDAN
jgi:hypothetical protein